MNSHPPCLLTRALSCLRERRMPDRLLALQESIATRFGPAFFQKRQAAAIRRTGTPASLQNLREICRTAWQEGASISMENIVYGPAHWETSGVLAKAPPYYNFLAGFVRSQHLRKIVEVGTWYGGSSQALDRGLTDSGKIVTIDVTLYNPDGLTHLPRITRLTGDAARPEILQGILAQMAPPIDLLYLDGDHRYESNRDILQLYGRELRPQWVIFDDIHWQWTMEKLWARILKFHAPYALDVGTELEFRQPGKNGNGFGVVDFRDRNDYRV